MPESDLIWMSLLVFLPAAFARRRCCCSRRGGTRRCAGGRSSAPPARSPSSLCVVVGYYELLDRYPDANGFPRYGAKPRLDARADQAASDAAQPIPKALQSSDWVARRPWIARFDIHYALGVDGISLPLVLLTALVTFLADRRELEDREVRPRLPHPRACCSKPA